MFVSISPRKFIQRLCVSFPPKRLFLSPLSVELRESLAQTPLLCSVLLQEGSVAAVKREALHKKNS